MQAVILAGGLGIRMGEETITSPKPMIKIGQMPILWHIMKNLHSQGVKNFLILGGYKVEVIHEFFRNYRVYKDDAVFYNARWDYLRKWESEDWTVGVVDTGTDTKTAGRLLRAAKYIDDEPFILTYGDGLADIDIQKLIESSGDNLVTVTAVHAPGRFGTISINEKTNKVEEFREKPLSNDWINGGFWYMKPEAFRFLGINEMLEDKGIQRIIDSGAVGAYKHTGFWHPMDTRRDREYLTTLWERRNAPWKNW